MVERVELYFPYERSAGMKCNNVCEYTKSQQDVYAQHLKKMKSEFQERWDKQDTVLSRTDDFERLRILGIGAFGTVYLVKRKKVEKYFAMKTIEKEQIIKQKQRDHIFNEKRILCCVNFPFVVYMAYFSKDNVYIHFIMPFVLGGEMFLHLRKIGKFNEALASFYGGQVILAIEYLHACGLIYRDLKPENILIDITGYIKLTDFGFCKLLRGRAWTLCGTPEYLAPELILSKGYGTPADWWAVGILLYEMVAGYPPFYASSPMKIYERIVAAKYKTPRHFSPELKHLLKNTLQLEVTRRYGGLKNGTMDFKTHSFFKEIDWDALVNRQIPAPFIPNYNSPADASNFDDYAEVAWKDNEVCLYETEFADF